MPARPSQRAAAKSVINFAGLAPVSLPVTALLLLTRGCHIMSHSEV